MADAGNGQGDVPGVAPAPRPTDRLFFGVHPDTAALQRIDRLALQLREAHGLTGKPLGPARYHVTQLFLGDFTGVPQPLVDELRRFAEGLRIAPFRVMFDRVASFRKRADRAPLVMLGGDGVDGLLDLHEALARPFPKADAARAAPAFTPHLTLLYDAQRVEEHAVDPIVWTVREFSLVHSAIGQSRHTVLGRWALRG